MLDLNKQNTNNIYIGNKIIIIKRLKNTFFEEVVINSLTANVTSSPSLHERAEVIK
jgi:hypothetical protein